MIRLFEFQDLDQIMEIWLEESSGPRVYRGGALEAEFMGRLNRFCPMQRSTWMRKRERFGGFIGMDADYVAGLFVKDAYRGRGIRSPAD